MQNEDSTRRMETVIAIQSQWYALDGGGEDPLHRAWLGKAAMWTAGRRDDLPPHPHLTFHCDDLPSRPRWSQRGQRRGSVDRILKALRTHG
jgi:hypothetical protein